MDLKRLGGMNGHIKKLQVFSQLLLGVAVIPQHNNETMPCNYVVEGHPKRISLVTMLSPWFWLVLHVGEPLNH